MGTAEHTIVILRIEARSMQTELDELRRQIRDSVPRADLDRSEKTTIDLRVENQQLRTEICRLQSELDVVRHRLLEVWPEVAPGQR